MKKYGNTLNEEAHIYGNIPIYIYDNKLCKGNHWAVLQFGPDGPSLVTLDFANGSY
jgi:hypothetical protein